MAEIRRSLSAAQRAALEGVAAEAKASGTGAVLLMGAAGAPGMRAAETLAASIGASVVRLNVAEVTSKYLGETEKHIDAVFKDAEASGAVLFLDEADQLLGKRTDVKDAHDRYANIETNYLLARVEAYSGVVVLATSLSTSTDPPRIRRPLRVIDDPPR